MCSKPDPAETYRYLSLFIHQLQHETGNVHPAHDYAWAGARTYYGLLESA